jgi:transcriptional regulator GlxA family with amidase domain
MTSRQTVVERAEAFVRANADRSIRVSSLCQAVGLSERGLRNAFQLVHGQSPKQWMLNLRLQDVRRDLVDASNLPTVTSIATKHGFFELGRFAVTYRQAFGETPSKTLHGTARKSAPASKRPRKGD